ncbi:hypothetical protein [Streptomyces acidiscabies]|uniref:hypothetical protein n=1 Tax=Streptomyces acidiscabies TaxID=42234 RepID=UPI0009532DBE|nr:hypothetical protein [Streptomyces acidiscabies]
MSKLATQSWAVRRALAARQPFTTHGALSATDQPSYDVGRLPHWWADLYRSDFVTGRVRYQVYSGSTPIAWVLDDGTVVVPHVRYSAATSRHQGLLYALDLEPGSFPKDGQDVVPVTPLQAPGSEEWPRFDAAQPGPFVRRDFAPVRMEYSESYSVRHDWATSYDVGPASGVKQVA